MEAAPAKRGSELVHAPAPPVVFDRDASGCPVRSDGGDSVYCVKGPSGGEDPMVVRTPLEKLDPSPSVHMVGEDEVVSRRLVGASTTGARRTVQVLASR